MNKYKLAFTVFGIILISSIISFAQQEDCKYKVINYSTTIVEGKAIEKNLLLKNDVNKIAQVTLRNGKAMGTHTEKNGFWVLGTAGTGELVLGENKKIIELKQGVMVLVKPGVPHNVIAKPELSIMVIKFLDGDTPEKNHGQNSKDKK